MNRFICAEQANSPTTIVVYVVLIIALVFLLVAPMFTQRKRRKQYEQMLGGIKVGDLVETGGGVIGRIVKMTDKGDIKTVVIETGSKTEKSYMEIDMRMISMVLKSSKAELPAEENEKSKTTESETETKNETTETAKAEDETKIESSEKSEEKPKKKRTTSSVKKK